MYMMVIDPEQVTELYNRREALKQYGIRKPIAKQVREAISEYITKNNNEKSPLTGTQKAFLKTKISTIQK